MLGFDNLKGGDLVTDTNGLQNEGFDQQAGTSELSWQASDKVTLKYIFGYSSFFYDRNTDVDLTSSDVFDNQFYVSQEAEYTSHELQAFTDVSDNFSMTIGLVLLRLEDHAARRLLRQPLYAESAVRLAVCQSRIWNRPPRIPYSAVLGHSAFSGYACRRMQLLHGEGVRHRSASEWAPRHPADSIRIQLLSG